MSRLTKCNYCTLQGMKRRAEERNVEVIMEHYAGWITAKYSDKEEPSAYFMELTSRCAC